MEKTVTFSHVIAVRHEIPVHKHSYVTMFLQDPRRLVEMDRVHNEMIQEHLFARKMVTVFEFLHIKGVKLPNTMIHDTECMIHLAIDLGWDQIIPEVEPDDPADDVNQDTTKIEADGS